MPQHFVTTAKEGSKVYMKVLAIDSAMNGCLACLCEVNSKEEMLQVIAQERHEMSKGQAERLMPMIERVMQKTQTGYNALDLIGVTNGPGAFTGMRIAIATAKAIALAADKPVIGVPTILTVLDSYLSKQKSEGMQYPYYAVIMETKRKDFYFQIFEKKEENVTTVTKGITGVTSAKVAGASEISSIISKKNIILIGDATDRLMSECGQEWPSYEIRLPEGTSLARLAENLYHTEAGNKGCMPVYLREAEIGKAKTKPRVLNF